MGRTTEFLHADPNDYATKGRLRFEHRSGAAVRDTPYELRYRRKDGTEPWTESIGRSIVGPDGTALGRKLEILIPPRHRPGHGESVELFQRTGVTARRMGRLGQVAGLRADGTEFPAEASISQLRLGNETTFTVILRDVTERAQAEQARSKLEAQLLQAQKMEALGMLAGGIAHDFNNILTAIGGNVELARLDAGPEDSALQHKLAETAKATRRAADLVRQILTFSRRQPLERVVVTLRELTLEAVGLLRSTLPVSIELLTSFAPDSPNVLADRTQLHQVLMNLVVNAAQAIGTQPGRIEISLAAVSGDTGVAGLALGRYARLGVVKP